MIRGAFFDIDGTLLPETEPRVPQSTKEAILRLKEQGILVFAATGRHLLEINDLPLGDIPFDGYVLLNGQLCLDGSHQVLYDNEMKGSDKEKMLQIFWRKDLPVMIIEKDRMYINTVNETVEKAQFEIHTPVPEVKEYEGEKIYQFVVYAANGDVLGSLEEKLPHCKMTYWNPNAVDVIARDGGKMNGIRQMLRYYHLTSEEIIAFGDGENDRDMLSYAGIGVAMGNAGHSLKQIADYVTGSADKDGIRDALRHFGLL